MTKRSGICEKEIIVDGVTYTVEYIIVGKYYPPTYETPAEFPEVEIQNVYVYENNKQVRVDDTSELEDIFETKIMEELN